MKILHTAFRFSLYIILFVSGVLGTASAQGRYDTANFILNAGLRPGIVRTMGDTSGGLIIDTCFSCYSGGGGSGTVTSVSAVAHQGLSVSGSPITTSGTLTFGITNGSLGDSLMAKTYLQAANNLSDIVSASTARSNLGLGSSATHASTDYFLVANNLSEGTAATMRTNLGLGSLAVLSSVDLSGGNATGTLAAARFPALSGDATTSAGSLSTTVTAVQNKTITLATGYLKYTGSAWAFDNSTFLTGNQTITLSGDVSGSGATAITTTIGANAVTNSMLAGSIAYSKLALTGAILNADLAGSIAYSKLSLTGAILNADLAGSIALTKLANLSGTSLLIGSSASSAAVQEITLGTNLSMSGATLNASGSSPGSAIFGSGGDGSLNYDGTTAVLGVSPSSSVYTLAREIYPSAMTVHSGVTIKVGGYRIYCSGTLTDSGTIQNNGKDAVGNTAGAVTTNNSIGGGAAGGNGGSAGVGANGSQTSSSMGGNGGAGGISGQGQSAGAAGTANVINNSSIGGASAYMSFSCLNTGTMVGSGSLVLVQGGGGGSGGGGAQTTSGGGGGGGGGILLINAYTIINPGTISANGGNGGNAGGTNAGTGGGGGGGGVLIISHAYSGNAAVANGGSPGPTKTGTGVVGSSGSNGKVVSVTY